MKKPVLFALLAAVAAGLVAGILFWTPGNTTPPPELETVLLPQPKAITAFQLTDQDGKSFGPERLKGKWTVIFFGYTQCPDICPTTLGALNGFLHRLRSQGNWRDDNQILFVSVDPKRDSPRHLKDYLAYFDPVYSGATGERAQIDALVAQFGAVYMFEGDTNGDTYTVNHSASLYIVDPKGRLYAKILPPYDPPQMADTFVRLRDFYSR
jgi:protein SCO1/2